MVTGSEHAFEVHRMRSASAKRSEVQIIRHVLNILSRVSFNAFRQFSAISLRRMFGNLSVNMPQRKNLVRAAFHFGTHERASCWSEQTSPMPKSQVEHVHEAFFVAA